MFYRTKKSYEKFAVVDMVCPICGHESKTGIAREVNLFSFFLLFNFYSIGDIIGTCGHCHENIKFKDKNEINDLLEKKGIVNKNPFL